MTKMKTIIHVNQRVIQHNNKHGTRYPPLTIKKGKENVYAQEVYGTGNFRVIHNPDKPLSCGAKVWIEAQGEVFPQQALSWEDLVKFLEEDTKDGLYKNGMGIDA